MRYVRFTKVDSETGVSCMERPCQNGPSNPKLKGLKVSFALESLYPTDTPVLYGTVDDDADVDTAGVEEVSKNFFDAAYRRELEDRLVKVKTNHKETIMAHYQSSLTYLDQQVYEGIPPEDVALIAHAITFAPELVEEQYPAFVLNYKKTIEEKILLMKTKNKALEDLKSSKDSDSCNHVLVSYIGGSYGDNA